VRRGCSNEAEKSKSRGEWPQRCLHLTLEAQQEPKEGPGVSRRQYLKPSQYLALVPAGTPAPITVALGGRDETPAAAISRVRHDAHESLPLQGGGQRFTFWCVEPNLLES